VIWLAASFCFAGGTAQASPWLLRPGQLVVSTSYDQGYARGEFLDGADNGEIPFSLQGLLTSSTLGIGGRLGIVEGFEMELRVPLKLVNYAADSVILIPEPEGGTEGIDYYQRNVIDLGRSVAGVGDIELAARFAISKRRLVSALELSLSMPTGYDGPSGTFGNRPTSTEQFVNNVGQYVKPQNIEDDVTLGDGVLVFTPRFLVGMGLKGGTFIRAATGLALRTNGASHQFKLSGKIGQRLAKWLIVWAGGDLDVNVTTGRVIGVSVAAEDPDLPAAEYGGLTNLKLRTPRLEYKQFMPGVGAILRVSKASELYVSYGQVVWGDSVAATRTVSVGLAVRGSVL